MCIPLWRDAIRDAAHRSSFSPCLDGRARSPVPRRLSRERFRPRLGTITHRQAGQTGGRQATQQVLAVHAGSAFRGSAEQDTRGRHGPVHVEAAHRRLFGAIPACLSPPPPACDRCSSSSPLATSYCTSDGAAPAGPPNTRPTDSSSHVELVLAAPGAGCVGLAPLRGFPCKTWPEANTILHTDDASPKTTPLLKRASTSS